MPRRRRRRRDGAARGRRRGRARGSARPATAASSTRRRRLEQHRHHRRPRHHQGHAHASVPSPADRLLVFDRLDGPARDQHLLEPVEVDERPHRRVLEESLPALVDAGQLADRQARAGRCRRRPDVTTTSPGWRSSVRFTNLRPQPSVTVPSTMPRARVRCTIASTPLLWSVMSSTRAAWALARNTWPTTPPGARTAAPLTTPSRSPRSIVSVRASPVASRPTTDGGLQVARQALPELEQLPEARVLLLDLLEPDGARLERRDPFVEPVELGPPPEDRRRVAPRPRPRRPSSPCRPSGAAPSGRGRGARTRRRARGRSPSTPPAPRRARDRTGTRRGRGSDERTRTSGAAKATRRPTGWRLPSAARGDRAPCRCRARRR